MHATERSNSCSETVNPDLDNPVRPLCSGAVRLADTAKSLSRKGRCLVGLIPVRRDDESDTTGSMTSSADTSQNCIRLPSPRHLKRRRTSGAANFQLAATKEESVMSKARIAAAASIMTAVSFFPVLAYAQATRTWVSGVGDDVNPCSRTAPCKTFPGAISKTAAAGEIDTLDPGGFGAVTITKSITIDGTSGLAGVLVSGTNAVVVNATSSDVVILRNLELNGTTTGLTGILILGAGDVRVENCKIYGFSARGIDDRRTSGHLYVTNTVVSNNGQTGILALSSGGSTLNVIIDHVQMHDNGNTGFAITGGARGTVVHSSATSNTSHGFYADSGAILDLNDSVSFGNLNIGIASLGGATIRLSNTTVTNNGTGLSASPGANILSYGSNRIAGNLAGNGPPTGTLFVQ
jgi:hypothetical protein